MKTLRFALLLASLSVASCTNAPPRVPALYLLVPGARLAETVSLRGVAAIDEDIAFVSGSAGTLKRTLDGGGSWQDIAPPGTEGCDFRDVEAFDRDTVLAMVAGQPARVYRTEDGGANWDIVVEDPRPGAFFDAMAFAGDYGVMFGDAIDGQFALLQTDDGGRTWRDRSGVYLPKPQPGEAAFAASGTCLVAVSDGNPEFCLATGGGPARMVKLGPAVPNHHWSRSLPLQSGANSKGAFSIAWHGKLGVAVGGDYRLPQERKGTAAWSNDGGETWAASDALGFRSAVVWLDARSLLSVGSHGSSFSNDAGRSWTELEAAGYHALSMGKDGAVWAVGAGGQVGIVKMVLPD